MPAVNSYCLIAALTAVRKAH